jgi:hypothetical protein
MPTENVPTPITLAARRAQAAAIVAEASGLGLLTASLVVDLVDVTTAAMLGAVGLRSIEIRSAAASIWGEQCPRDWQRAVERYDQLAEQRRAHTVEETDMTATTETIALPDGATITREGNRVTLTVELPADVVLDGTSEWAIRKHLAEAADWVVYVPWRQREIDRGE